MSKVKYFIAGLFALVLSAAPSFAAIDWSTVTQDVNSELTNALTAFGGLIALVVGVIFAIKLVRRIIGR